MDQDEESKKRAGDSAVALTKTGIGIGATALFGPIGGIAAAALAQLAGHAVGLLKEKRAKRIDKLHEELLNGVAEENVPRLLASLRADEEASAHYASILEMVYQDDEEEKVPLYA